MPPPIKIHIIGAGLSGLVLSRALLHRGIRSRVLEKARDFLLSRPRNRHGITLHPASYAPLLPILGLDDAAFRRRVAVDAGVGGVGRIVAPASEGDGDGVAGAGAGAEAIGFRANRGRLEALLAEGLDIMWEKEVEGVRVEGERGERRVEVRFGDGEVWGREEGGGEVLVVGADGPHSVVRGAVAPGVGLEVLPFAVYNGRRKYAVGEFEGAFGAAFEKGNVLEARHGEVRLGVGIDDRTHDEVHLGYTYSRPARSGGDALFRPQRSKSAATEIPDALFEEVLGLQGEMDPVFRKVFDVEQMRKDRMLNWLMRTLEIDTDQLKRFASDGIMLTGDAVHAEAILGGQGANEAITDGIKLAEAIASNGMQRLEEFYDARHGPWKRSNAQSKDRIGNMHANDGPHL